MRLLRVVARDFRRAPSGDIRLHGRVAERLTRLRGRTRLREPTRVADPISPPRRGPIRLRTFREAEERFLVRLQRLAASQRRGNRVVVAADSRTVAAAVEAGMLPVAAAAIRARAGVTKQPRWHDGK